MNKRYQTYIIFALLFALLVVSLVKNYHNTGINQYAYVIAVGLDAGDNQKLKLTLQVANPNSQNSSGSSGGGGSSESADSVVHSIECDTLSSGITWFNSYFSKEINLSHCKAFVVSKELASKGISEYVYTVMNNIQFRENANFIVSTIPTFEFLENSKPVLEKLSANYYDNILTTSQYTGYTQDVTIGDFFSTFHDTFMSPVAIIGSDSSERTAGIAVFNQDKFVGKLNTSETISHMIVSNLLQETQFHIPISSENDKWIDLRVKLKKNTKNHVKLVNETPYITSDIYLKAELLSIDVDTNVLDENYIKQLEEYVNYYVSQSITDYLYKTSRQYQADIDGFGSSAAKYFLTWQDWQNYSWLDQYSNAFFNVNTHITIQSSQLVLKSKT